MPVERRPAKPRHNRPDLVKKLEAELTKPSTNAKKGAPRIIEEQQRYGQALHVTVIWESWSDVPLEERGAVVMDAYQLAGKTGELQSMTLVLGLTSDEARKLGID